MLRTQCFPARVLQGEEIVSKTRNANLTWTKDQFDFEHLNQVSGEASVSCIDMSLLEFALTPGQRK